jgi:hypothetical protein
MNEYTTGTGQKIVRVHQPYQCRGPWCVIHNPVPGPWSSWPTHWIQDSDQAYWLSGIMTRRCPHGFLHPCVEDVVMYDDGMPEHGCDGCPCGPEHIGFRTTQLPSAFSPLQVADHAEGQNEQHHSEPPQVDATPDAERGEGAEDGRGEVEQRRSSHGDSDTPLDYFGNPAQRPWELSLRDRFFADQDEAGAEAALAHMVQHLVTLVLQNGGAHPGRANVSAEWLTHMATFTDSQVRGLVQFACWHLAEGLLVEMERNGSLAAVYGIRLGKGFGRGED